jgi:hypothetical protein
VLKKIEKIEKIDNETKKYLYDILQKETGININIIEDDEERTLFLYNEKKTRRFKLPNKTKNILDWILKKINEFEENDYKNLVSIFEKINISGKTYPTTFGISYFSLFKNKEMFDNDILNIETKLKEIGLEYKVEWSDQRYVLRFIISKKEEILEKIRSFSRKDEVNELCLKNSNNFENKIKSNKIIK